MNEENNIAATEDANFKPWGMEVKQFCMFMHLAQFLSPILSIVMWSTNKQESDFIDRNGKIITNWVISSVIYLTAGFILTFIFIGFAVLFVVPVCATIFAIKGAIDANNGKIYNYPLTINFIK